MKPFHQTQRAIGGEGIGGGGLFDQQSITQVLEMQVSGVRGGNEVCLSTGECSYASQGCTMLPDMSRLWLCLEDNAVVQMSAAELDIEMCGVFLQAVSKVLLPIQGLCCMAVSVLELGPKGSLPLPVTLSFPYTLTMGCRVHVSGAFLGTALC